MMMMKQSYAALAFVMFVSHVWQANATVRLPCASMWMISSGGDESHFSKVIMIVRIPCELDR